jgi:hypothetical protein
MKLNLDVLYVDMKVGRIDEASYSEMNPNGDATDMDEIKKAWKATVTTKRASMVKEKKILAGISKPNFVR